MANASQTETRRSRFFWLLVGVLCLTILVGLGTWQWRLLQQALAVMEASLQQSEVQLSRLAWQLEQLADALRQQSRLRQFEDRQRVEQREAHRLELRRRAQIAKIRLGRADKRWLLTEVIYLLDLAHSSLNLEEGETAVAALRLALTHLQALPGSPWQASRQALVGAIEALGNWQVADRRTLGEQLSKLLLRVDSLQPHLARSPESISKHFFALNRWMESGYRSRLQQLQQRMETHRRLLLRRKLRLMLERARLALLQAQDKQARDLLERVAQRLTTDFQAGLARQRFASRLETVMAQLADTSPPPVELASIQQRLKQALSSENPDLAY